MKKRYLYTGIVAFLILILLTVLLRKQSSDAQPLLTTNRTKQESLQALAPRATTTPDFDATNKIQEMNAALRKLNNEPISFYGRVIDQDGAPVPGVDVKGAVMVQTEWMKGELGYHKTISDKLGYFQFQNLRGRSLSVSLSKAGYEFISDNTPFVYSLMYAEKERHSPDPTNPVSFTIWKKAGAMPMIEWSLKSFKIPVDNSVVEVDILKAAVVKSGGSLRVRSTRSPMRLVPHEKFEWSMTFEVPGGGLQPIVGKYSNEAPAEGYFPSVTVEMKADAEEWTGSLTRSFYFKLGESGPYGKMTVMIIAHSDPPPVSFSFLKLLINPNGSRGLEYDSSLRIPN